MVEAPLTAVSVKSAGTAGAPVLPLSTTFFRVSVGTIAVLVMVQVASFPSTRVTEVLSVAAPPVHTQALAV